MSEFTLAVFIAAVFLLAGGIKGVLGLGLPTVAMGLLSVAMTPAEAAGILVIPALVTNIWQVALGPALLTLVRRFAWTRRSWCRASASMPSSVPLRWRPPSSCMGNFEWTSPAAGW